MKMTEWWLIALMAYFTNFAYSGYCYVLHLHSTLRLEIHQTELSLDDKAHVGLPFKQYLFYSIQSAYKYYVISHLVALQMTMPVRG